MLDQPFYLGCVRFSLIINETLSLYLPRYLGIVGIVSSRYGGSVWRGLFSFSTQTVMGLVSSVKGTLRLRNVTPNCIVKNFLPVRRQTFVWTLNRHIFTCAQQIKIMGVSEIKIQRKKTGEEKPRINCECNNVSSDPTR